jgi:hypothetical protein
LAQEAQVIKKKYVFIRFLHQINKFEYFLSYTATPETLAVGTCMENIGWLPFGGSCYHIVTEAANWNSAKDTCETLTEGRGHLAVLDSAAEYSFVHSAAFHNDTSMAVWVGAGKGSLYCI